MAAESAFISERLAFATARTLFRSNYPLSHRSFHRLSLGVRHYSPSSGQGERVALRPWAHTATWRPPEVALDLRTYSSTSREEGGGASKKGEKTRVSPSGTAKEQHGSVIMQFVEREGQPKELTTAKKVVEAGKDAGYMGFILAGVGFAGVLFWAVFSEFFSSNSPQKLFAKALRRVKANEQAKQLLGEPISGFGDYSGRGRRRHISSQEYIVNGEDYMRIIFYVAGSKRKGTAHMDLKKNENGKYLCRYLIVEMDGYPHAVITIEDYR